MKEKNIYFYAFSEKSKKQSSFLMMSDKSVFLKKDNNGKNKAIK